jgi:hypothetical protein
MSSWPTFCSRLRADSSVAAQLGGVEVVLLVGTALVVLDVDGEAVPLPDGAGSAEHAARALSPATAMTARVGRRGTS